MIFSKKETLQRLRSNPLYQKLLKAVDEKQAKNIASITEGFLSELLDAAAPALSEAATDPVAAKEMMKVISERTGVVIDSIATTSGSR
jgi:hypothetical protein